MPKKVTNEKLARMIQKGFLEVKTELKSEIKSEINGVKGQIAKVNKNLEARIGQVDSKLDAEVERHDDQDLRIKDHEKRIVVLENKDKVLT